MPEIKTFCFAAAQAYRHHFSLPQAVTSDMDMDGYYKQARVSGYCLNSAAIEIFWKGLISSVRLKGPTIS